MSRREQFSISADDLIALIRELATQGELPRDLGKAALTPSTKLEDLGLDSLGKVILLSALDEWRGVYVPDHMISAGMTLGALAALGKTHASGRSPSMSTD